MSRNSKFSKEIKIRAYKDYELGKGSYQYIAKSIGTTKISMQEWYSTYLYHGTEAFNSSNRNAAYSIEFKRSIVEMY